MPSIANIHFPSDHMEHLSRAASVLTVDPLRSILFYAFPRLGAYFNGYQELRGECCPGTDAEAVAATRRILAEVEQLRRCAGIREITPYVALNYEFACAGGAYSLTKPALLMPEQHLFRRTGRAFAGNGRWQESTWVFSDDQIRFCIARELGQIKENSILLRIAIKVCLIAAVFAIYATPLGWGAGLPLLAGAIGLYIASERLFQGRADQIGAEILGKRIGAPRSAVAIAIETLEKQQAQNLYRRGITPLGKWYITRSGNNTFDLLHPYLSTRIERLQTMLEKLT